MSSHKAQQRNKQQNQRVERDKGKPSLPPATPRPAPSNATVPEAAINTSNGMAPPTRAPHPLPPPAPVVVPVTPATEATPAVADRQEPVAPPMPTPKAASTNGDQHNSDNHTPGRHITQQTPTPPGELSEMFATMRALFVQDRANGSRTDAARCGVCYLTFPRDELVYREAEGFYACPACEQALRNGTLPMIRRQRR